MVTAQAVAKGKGPICDMAVKYTDKFRSTGLCPVDGGSNGIPITLDACADAHILIRNASFFGFCPMLAGFSWCRSVKLFSFVAVKDKGFVRFGYTTKADTAYFRELLQGHKYFVPHIKDSLMGTAGSLRGVINGITMNGVLYNFAPYPWREMGV